MDLKNIYSLFHVIMFSSIFIIGCNQEKIDTDVPDVSDVSVNTIRMDGVIGDITLLSRVHWLPDDNGKLLFNWDNTNDEMQSIVYGTDGIKNFEGGAAFSYVTVNTVADERLKANLSIQKKLSVSYATGDKIYAFSPVKESAATASVNEQKVVVSMTIPLAQSQNGAGDTDFISRYALIAGGGDVNVDGETASTSINFNVIPTLFCFNITNNTGEELVVNEVSIKGTLNNVAALSIDDSGINPLYSGGTEDNEFKVSVSGMAIENAGNGIVYAIAFPSTIQKDDVLTFSFKGIYGSNNIILNKDVTIGTEMKFDSNKYQIFNMPVSLDELSVNWNEASWGNIVDTPVTGSSSSVDVTNGVNSWGGMQDNNITGNKN